MRIKSKGVLGLIGLLLAVFFGVLADSLPNSEVLSENVATDLEYAKVVKVIDGDTVELEGGQKVRYIGMDTPETKDPRKLVECMGNEAFLRNRQLVEGKLVGLERDVSDTDKYGRLLRYVYVEGAMVNRILVAEGLAKAVTYPPDVANQLMLKEAEQEARGLNMGLWDPKKCDN